MQEPTIPAPPDGTDNTRRVVPMADIGKPAYINDKSYKTRTCDVRYNPSGKPIFTADNANKKLQKIFFSRFTRREQNEMSRSTRERLFKKWLVEKKAEQVVKDA